MNLSYGRRNLNELRGTVESVVRLIQEVSA